MKILVLILVAGLVVEGRAGCSEGGRSAVPDDCTSYLECAAGYWIPASCGFGRRYDSPSRRCVPWSLARCCTLCKEGDRRGLSEDCHGYQECANCAWSTRSCGLLYRYYDPTTESCSRKDDHCLKPTTTPTPPCRDGVQLPLLDPNCKKYLKCEEGKFVEEQCGVLREFDVATNSCRWYKNAKCYRPPTTPRPCQTGERRPEADCKKYAECHNGRFVENSCSWLKKFDSKTKRCVWFGATCYTPDIPTTTPKPACKGGDRIPLPDCKRFKECNQGKFVEQDCGRMDFDAVELKCVSTPATCFKAECANGEKVPLEDCNKYSECEGGRFVTKSCHAWQKFDYKRKECAAFGSECYGLPCTEGKKKPAEFCSEYYECVGGTLVAKLCPPGQTFDPEKDVCRPGKPCPQPPSKVCIEGTRIPLPDCKSYKECKGGKLQMNTCWWPKEFDAVSLECVWKAKCYTN